MFEKRDVRAFPGVGREALFRPAAEWWSRQGFYVYQRAPYHISGESYYSRIGLRREFEMRMDEVDGTTHVDLTLKARISDEGIIGGAVATVIFWPVAVVGGAVSYSEYENDARNLMGSFWSYVGQLASAPKPAGAGPRGQFCAGCGAALQTEWKVCPYCGRPRP